MKPTPTTRRVGAFSLIELMIVIVIIAMLTAIGLPAFFSATRRAEWAKVQAQMKSIVTAFHTYSADHDGYMPPAYYPDGRVKASWLDTTIFPYVYPESGFTGEDDEGNEVAYDSVNADHLRDTVFVVKASVDTNPEEECYYNHSFLLNRSLVAEATALTPEFAPRKITMFEDWTSVMLLTEGPQGDHNSVSVTDLTQIEDGLKRYDGKFVHFAFLDGHVEMVKADAVKEMEKVSKGAAVDQQVDAWHTAWFGFSPDRMPNSAQRAGAVNY